MIRSARGACSSFASLQHAWQHHAARSAQHARQHGFSRRAHSHVQHDGIPCAASGSECFTITTPLYYVNAAPHMGSAYPTIAADVAARFQRLQGRRVRFVTGTDEHGEKVALAAQRRGMTPQQHCDDIVCAYKDLWNKLDISYDSFVRTTDDRHAALVREVLARVWERGDIYLSDYEGWYCVDCEEFKDESEMEPGHTCPTHRKPCQHRKEGNYFFRLSRYQPQIEALLASGGFVQPASRQNELVHYLKEGLRDFSISRASVDWGLRMPQDSAQTVYVWFDALIGYLSGLFPPGASPSLASLDEHGWPATVHVIGKDILRFHALYWPGMLMSAGLPVPNKVFAHGFLTKDGLKMGKSLGNVLDPQALVGAYGPDAVRFYFMRDMVFGQDGDFSEARFRDSVNAALANNVGNMLNRTLNLLGKYCGGKVPADIGAAVPEDHELRATARVHVRAAAAAYADLSFHSALESLTALCSKGNEHLDRVQPWVALKKGDAAEQAAAATSLCAVLEVVRIAAVGLSPVTPGLSARVYAQLGFTPEQFKALTWEDTAWGALCAGHATAAPQPVFARLEGDMVTQAAPGQAAPAAAPAAPAAAGEEKRGKGKGKGPQAQGKPAAAAAGGA